MLLWELGQVRVRYGSGGRIQERVLIDTGTGTEVGTAAGAGASCPDKPADCRLGVVGWHLNHRRMQSTEIPFYVSFYEISGRICCRTSDLQNKAEKILKNSSTMSLSQAN